MLFAIVVERLFHFIDVRVVVDEDHLLEQVPWRAIYDAVDRTKHRRPSFVFEYENNASCWKIGWIFSFFASIGVKIDKAISTWLLEGYFPKLVLVSLLRAISNIRQWSPQWNFVTCFQIEKLFFVDFIYSNLFFSLNWVKKFILRKKF